jgi:riboflavin kinase / FMN adenylyltransferase
VKVYTNLESFKDVRRPVLTTGTFDGVHLGHRKIITRLKEIARLAEGETVIFTFYPHPRMVLFPDDTNLKLLNTQQEKISLLEKAGIDHLILYPFSKEFSRLTAIEYVRDILVNQLHIHRLVIGYDHHFGRNREGSIENLRELAPLYDFGVEEIPAEEVDDVKVSSTKIRTALSHGDVASASGFLGYRYELNGKVVAGKQIGRSIGFPTANIQVTDTLKLIPADGVYAVKVNLKSGLYNGMLNIGKKPTVNPHSVADKSIEVHIFDFNGELYNEPIGVEFAARIRGEEKFADLSFLKIQLEQDKHNALRILQCI